MAGCASIRDACHEDALYHRMCHEANRVWRECKASYEGQQPCFDDFELGFKDGYVGVAMGADGCPPTLPHKRYWHPSYRTAEGKAQVIAWYSGYMAGANAALSVGVQDRNRLPTAIEVFGRGDTFQKSAGTAHLEPTPTLEALPPAPETPLMAPPVESNPSPITPSAYEVAPEELPPAMESTPLPDEGLPDVFPRVPSMDSYAQSTQWTISSEFFELPEVQRK